MKPWMIIVAVVVVVGIAVTLYFMNAPSAPNTANTPTPSKQETQMDWPAQQAAYLAENIKKPGWQTTASGIQYTVLKASDGTGPKPAPGSEVTVHYEGRLIDGKVFDSSYARNEPMTFPLSGVIMGWQEGVPLMRVGETYEFLIPANLAYGDRGVSIIPGGSALIFKIELLAAKTPAP
jgi:FKBP-type peptidyl-prolyl cis-trans isomerase FkpA